MNAEVSKQKLRLAAILGCKALLSATKQRKLRNAVDMERRVIIHVSPSRRCRKQRIHVL
jgi:hypothetical protein